MPNSGNSKYRQSQAQLLPVEVSVQQNWFGRASNYPIFSRNWYRYRSVSFLAGICMLSLLLVAMVGLPLRNAPGVEFDGVDVFNVTAIYCLPLLILCLLGPGLAVLLHALAWPRRKESVLIMLALLLGIGASFGSYRLLIALYERPYHDPRSGDRMIRFLPSPHFNVSWSRIPTRPSAPAHPVWFEQTNEQKEAQEELIRVQKKHAAATSTAPSPLSAEEQKDYQDWLIFTQGKSVVSAAEKTLIESRGLAAADKLTRATAQMAADHTAVTLSPEASMEIEAATNRLLKSMPVATQSVIQAPSEAQKKANEITGVIAIIIVLTALGLLLAWLSGLIDFLAFIGQRGKLADLLREQELRRARAARTDAEMRLSVLAAQVEPHFLFNTLTSVRSAILSDQQRAAAMVDHLVSYLRSSIPQMRHDAGSTSVRLSTQLDAARAYLALMHERIPRLQYLVEVEPGLEEALVPPLMLISLVENAIKHGVEPKMAEARIEVRARRIHSNETEQIEVSVTDDGVGFGEASSGDGIGLANIQERLNSYYGEAASLSLKALPHAGVAAILRLPLAFDLPS